MIRRRLHALAVLALAAGLASCDAAAGGPAALGSPMPAYAARDLDGAERSLAELRGQPVLLNIWATWCHPCRKEMPDLQRLHEEYGPRGLQVVGVSIDAAGQERAIRDFMREYGADFQVWWDPEDRISGRFGARGVPTTYLIDTDGTLLWRHLGPVKADDPNLLTLIRQTLEDA